MKEQVDEFDLEILQLKTIEKSDQGDNEEEGINEVEA